MEAKITVNKTEAQGLRALLEREAVALEKTEKKAKTAHATGLERLEADNAKMALAFIFGLKLKVSAALAEMGE